MWLKQDFLRIKMEVHKAVVGRLRRRREWGVGEDVPSPRKKGSEEGLCPLSKN